MNAPGVLHQLPIDTVSSHERAHTSIALALTRACVRAGMANWAAMLPIDTVKSKYQVAPQGKYSGVMQVAKEIMKVDGVRGFYKGLAPVMVRAFPANAACFLGYEAAAAGLTKLGLE